MIKLYKSELLTEAGFPDHGFTQRSGGVSSGPFASLNLAHDVGDDQAAVVTNLERLRQQVGGESPLARVVKVHGTQVIAAGGDGAEPDAGWTVAPKLEADGLVAVAPPVTVAVQTADCAAVHKSSWPARDA